MEEKQVSSSIQVKVGLMLLLSIAGLLLFFSTPTMNSYVSDQGSNSKASANLDGKLVALSRASEKVTRYKSHLDFLTECRKRDLVPRGMRLGFARDALPKSEFLEQTITDTINFANREILSACKDTYRALVEREKKGLKEQLDSISHVTDASNSEAILESQKRKSKTQRKKLLRKKKKKLNNLSCEQEKTTTTPPPPSVVNKKGRNRRFKRRPHNPSQEQALQAQPTENNDDNLVVNLSDVHLTQDQTQVLRYGNKFAPTPKRLDHEKLKKDVEEGCRRVRLKELFYESTSVAPTFYKPTGYTPPSGRDLALDSYCATLMNKVDNYKSTQKHRDNLNPKERKALNELRSMVKDRQIRISCADKGGAIVVQNTSGYIEEGKRQLQDATYYTPLTADPTSHIASESNDLIDRLHADNLIDDNTWKWAQVDTKTVRCHQLYFLPKIHKSLTNPPGRPIVSGVNGPTENVSKLVDHWLQSYVKSLPSHIQDSTHMLRNLRNWNEAYGPFREGTRLVTIDVVGLYSNIPHEDIRTALQHFLDNYPRNDVPPTNRILELAEHVLKNNVFRFDEKVYQQVFGTAMGTPLAPSAANLFMGWLEAQLLTNSPVPVQEEMWRRFIDDIFLLWTGTEDELDQFFSHLNGFHPSIKFTWNSSTTSIPFLDINIRLENGFLVTDVYSKPTDSHAYLHPRSCHPQHVTKNIPYSLFLRLRRLCSNTDTFQKRCEEWRDYFLKRGYRNKLIEEAVQKASAIPRSETLEYRPKTKNSRPPCVISYHPANPPLRTWFNESQDLLHTSARMRSAMPQPPVLGERNCPSIRTLLMPSVLPTPVDIDSGCCKCENGCIVCREHLVQGLSFSSSNTREQFRIRQKLSCDSTNLVYLLHCDACQQPPQYVGQTSTTLRRRITSHRSSITTKANNLVSKHFNQPGHSVRNLKCIAVERVYTETIEARRRRENFWIDKLKTLKPMGLNASEKV